MLSAVKDSAVPAGAGAAHSLSKAATRGGRARRHLPGKAQVIDNPREQVVVRDQQLLPATGGDRPRLVEDQGNPHGPVIGSNRFSVIPHSPESTLAARKPLVGGENHELIPVQPETAQYAEDLADTVVNRADLGGVASNRRRVSEQVARSLEPGVRRLARE